MNLRRNFAVALVVAVASNAWALEGERDLLLGMHRREVFDNAIARIAGGDEKIAAYQILNDHEVLLEAKGVGRSALTVWFVDGKVVTLALVVRRDLSVLEQALADLHPQIRVEAAPDRDAVVLRGRVPDVALRDSAADIALRYLDARSAQGDGVVVARPENAGASSVRLDEKSTPRSSAEVINLIVVDHLPQRIEDKLGEALAALGYDGIQVRRLAKGPYPDDAHDVLVLEGQVRDQVSLVRALHVARSLYLGQDAKDSEIEVVADESGAIESGAGRGEDSNTNGLFGSSSGAFGGSSGGGASKLSNRLEANLARAKVLSMAGGRILSFIEVEDIPQVRVDVRMFEVNRDDLKSFDPEFSLTGNDDAHFGEDLRTVTSFLGKGFEQQLTATFHKVSVEAVFDLLESRGLGRSVSRPSLTVLSGERALFQVGGEVPIPAAFVSTAAGTAPGVGNAGVFSAIEFKSFGVQLVVKPLIGNDGMITLDVLSQIARPDESLNTLIRDSTGTSPLTTAFESRSVRTSARLNDGETLLLAGLSDRKSEDSASYTPVLEHVPIVGWLFKRYSMRDQDQEVVIALHPLVLRTPLQELPLWQFPTPASELRDLQKDLVGGELDDAERHSTSEP